MITDITERKRTEAVLLESEEKFRRTFELTPNPIPDEAGRSTRLQ
jgi:PAS domain-containing protein